MARFLIVDDSEFMCRVIQKILEAQGHETVSAYNGLEALEEIAQTTFDCIVSDLTMPKMDGFAFLSELQKKKSVIPVIVVSADIQDTTRKKCMDLGVRHFLNKHLEEDLLRDAVDDVLHHEREGDDEDYA